MIANRAPLPRVRNLLCTGNRPCTVDNGLDLVDVRKLLFLIPPAELYFGSHDALQRSGGLRTLFGIVHKQYDYCYGTHTDLDSAQAQAVARAG